MPAVFDQNYVKKLDGPNVKKAANKYDLAQLLMEDIRNFKKTNKLDRLVMVWCASTEIFLKQDPVHATIASFEKGLKENDPDIAPSMVYAYAALKMRHPLRQRRPQPDRGHPGHARAGPRRRGPRRRQGLQDRPDPDEDHPRPRLQGPPARPQRLVLDQHPRQPRRRGARRSRSRSRPRRRASSPSSTTSSSPSVYPDLYGKYYHKVRINYYPPRGDNKEGWDNIDIFGWLGYPMQIKINFLCRDSILAAPIVLDLVLFMDLAQRAGMKGIQEWLSFYFKSPMCAPGALPGARPLHPAHEAQEHAAAPEGRRADHPPGAGILRLRSAALTGP